MKFYRTPNKIKSLTSLLIALFILQSCHKEETPPIKIEFQSSTIAVNEFGGTKQITIDFSAPLRADVTLKVNINETTAAYGKDYTTDPDGSSKTISIPVSKGATSATFDFVPIPLTAVQPPRAVEFELQASSGLQPGTAASLTATIIDDGDVVQFSTAELTVAKFGGTQKIIINFPTPPSVDVALTVSIKDSTAVYGKDYTTLPDGSSKSITLQVVKGATSSSFSFIPTASMTITPISPAVNFKITSQSAGMHLGSRAKIQVTIREDDLVCYLPMNGNALDASYARNSTLLEGATLTTGRKSLANSAYNMDGVSNDIKISNSTALDTLQNLTLTAWIKPVSFDGNGNSSIIEKAYYYHYNPYYQYKLGITGDQHLNLPGSFGLSLSINGAYQYVFTPAGAWTPGNWYFVAGTFDGKNMVIYVNGVAAASYAVSGKLDHYGTDIYVGLVKNASIYTPGTFGDIRIYNRALSGAEITTLYSK